MIVKNCEDIKKYKKLAAFYELAAADMVDGVFNFRTMQEQRYMKFWNIFCITEPVNDDKDLKIVLWGSGLRDAYGKELTGKIADAEELGVGYDDVVKDHSKAVNDKKITFRSGTLTWLEKDFPKWDRLCVPLLRHDKMNSLWVISFS